jgi:bacterioferritin
MIASHRTRPFGFAQGRLLCAARPDSSRRKDRLFGMTSNLNLGAFGAVRAGPVAYAETGGSVRQSHSFQYPVLEEIPLKNETAGSFKKVSRSELIELLNEDLAREYQAIIAYVVYSQVLKGAEYMNIAGELEKHAAQELSHAIIIAQQIDYLGGMPTVEPKKVKTSEKNEKMLQFDLDNETETIRNYRERVRQCEALAEYAMSEQIREILIDEQDHQIALATALGKNVPKPGIAK